MSKFIIAIVYILLGVFFMGMLQDSSGRPYGAMFFFWPVIVPILAALKTLDIIFCIGEKIGEKFR